MDWDGKKSGNKVKVSLNRRGGKKVTKKLLAVVESRTVVEDDLAMLGSAVTFVVDPIVNRKPAMEFGHILVAGDFSKDRGGGYGVALGTVCDGGDLGGN